MAKAISFPESGSFLLSGVVTFGMTTPIRIVPVFFSTTGAGSTPADGSESESELLEVVEGGVVSVVFAVLTGELIKVLPAT